MNQETKKLFYAHLNIDLITWHKILQKIITKTSFVDITIFKVMKMYVLGDRVSFKIYGSCLLLAYIFKFQKPFSSHGHH